MSRRVSLVTQGCKVNQYETQVLLEGFLGRGWELLPFGREVDLTVINSCTVTAGSDRDLRRLVARARRASTGGRILVTGCRPQVDPDGTAALVGVDFIVGNPGKDAIPALATSGELPIDPAGAEGASFPARVSDEAVTRLDGRGRAILKIQDGCNLRCSFCIVPSARGASRSRGAEEAVERALLLEAHGYRELVLSGIQLGFYSDPDGRAEDLTALLRLLLERTSDLRFRLGSLLPRHITPALWSLFREEPKRLCPHFHVSLQSGDDPVLRAMKRPYLTDDYRALLKALCEELDDPCLGTDIIVGFPGEDTASFERSFEFVAGLPLSYAHVFPFSPRRGTRAAAMADPVSPPAKAERGRRLRELLAERGRAYRERQRRRTLHVIVEKRRKDGRLQGTSENYQRVVFEGDAHPCELVALTVTGAEGEALLGLRAESREPSGARA